MRIEDRPEQSLGEVAEVVYVSALADIGEPTLN